MALTSVDFVTCTVRDSDRQQSLKGMARNAQGAAEREDGKALAAVGEPKASGQFVGGAATDAEVASGFLDREQLREVTEAVRRVIERRDRLGTSLLEELSLSGGGLHEADLEGRNSRRGSGVELTFRNRHLLLAAKYTSMRPRLITPYKPLRGREATCSSTVHTTGGRPGWLEKPEGSHARPLLLPTPTGPQVARKGNLQVCICGLGGSRARKWARRREWFAGGGDRRRERVRGPSRCREPCGSQSSGDGSRIAWIGANGAEAGGRSAGLWGPNPIAVLLPRLDPFRVGDYTAQVSVVVTAQHCDGLAADVASNCPPAGDTPVSPVLPLTVSRPLLPTSSWARSRS